MAWIALGLGALVLIGVAVAWRAAVAGVETPAYAVERAEGRFEIRRYPALVVAEVSRAGDRQAAVRAGFGPLARYIFGRDRSGDGIAMTAPVTQTPEPIAMTAPVTQTAGAEGWTVRFIMPTGRGLDTLPAPAGDVRLAELPAARVAAIRFSGRWTDANFAARRGELEAWMAARGLAAAGPPTYAYYDDPFTPFFLRRNEVLIPLAD